VHYHYRSALIPSFSLDEGCDNKPDKFFAFGVFATQVICAMLTLSHVQIDDMKRHLERKVQAGKSKPKLKDIDPTILPAAWSVLRWFVILFILATRLILVHSAGVSRRVRLIWKRPAWKNKLDLWVIVLTQSLLLF
jgi:hypothetical protein